MKERIRILCVDDELNVLKALERVFMDEEYELITAVSGKEGLAIMEEADPVQVVVSDYRMPVMCGVDFLKEVCRRWPYTVRIVLSGYSDIGAVVGAINEGHIYRFIAKPWIDDELRVAIGNALERYYLKKSNRSLMEALQEKNEELEIINRDLEIIVEGKNAKILFQNSILTRSRNILDALPVAVFGIGWNGVIVQGNQRCFMLLGRGAEDLLGYRREHVLTMEMNGFVDAVLKGEATAGKVRVNGVELKMKGVVVKQPGQESIILVFDGEGRDAR